MLSLLTDTSPDSEQRRIVPVKDDLFTPEIKSLRRDLGTLALACADALTKTAQHYAGEDLWAIGTMPGYGPLADSVESVCRGFLANSHLSAPHTEIVSNTLKMSGDLRTAARGARQAVQIAFLFRADRDAGTDALQLLAPMADAVVAVAERTAFAVQTGDPATATQAAHAYRAVDALRIEVEGCIRTHQWDAYFSPTLQRMVRASAWNFAVAGEGMARVAARLIA